MPFIQNIIARIFRLEDAVFQCNVGLVFLFDYIFRIKTDHLGRRCIQSIAECDVKSEWIDFLDK